MFGASIALAIVSWKWLEVPIRKKVRLPTRRALVAGVSACAAACVAVGVWGAVTKGWPGRIDPKLLALADTAQYLHNRQDCDNAVDKQLSELCVRGASGITPDFALVGDSHANAVSPGVFAGAAAANRAGYQFTNGGYRPAFGFIRPGDKEGRVKTLDKALLQFLDSRRPRDVFIMAQWTAALKNEYTDKDGDPVPASEVLTKSIGWLVRTYPQTRFYIIEDNPIAPELSPILAAQAIKFGKQLSVGISRSAYEEQLSQFRPVLAELAKLPNVKVISIADLLCDRDFCLSTIEDKPLYRDTNHLSVTGATRLAELFRQAMSPVTATADPR
jgi:hypothetical protein